jgi:hypothetical protein
VGHLIGFICLIYLNHFNSSFVVILIILSMLYLAVPTIAHSTAVYSFAPRSHILLSYILLYVLKLLDSSLLTFFTSVLPSDAEQPKFTYSLRCSKRSHPARDRACTKRSHSAHGSGIWTLLPLVIAQKKMHLREIELETSSLECLGAAATTNQD